MPTVFITGFPGFLGSALLPRILARLAGHDAVCLVQRRFADAGDRRLGELVAAHPALRGRVRLVAGDITRDGPGVDPALRGDVTEIHHLAAVYDLSVARDVGVRVHMRRGLPATIYRPSIGVGDSGTGATQKFDGPYHAIRWLLRQPRRVAMMPVVGDPTATRFNVVPRDFVVDAIAHLAGLDASAGRTYQLADPAPLTVDGFLTAVAAATGQQVLRVRLPAELERSLIDRVPGVHRLTGIPSSTIAYFTHPTRYDTSNASADLAGSDVRCPSFVSYVAALVRFARAHPELGAAAMA